MDFITAIVSGVKTFPKNFTGAAPIVLLASHKSFAFSTLLIESKIDLLPFKALPTSNRLAIPLIPLPKLTAVLDKKAGAVRPSDAVVAAASASSSAAIEPSIPKV